MPTSETARRRAVRALVAHAPELAGHDVGELGRGLDNAAFHAGGLVLRVAEDGHSVRREARLLAEVAANVSLPVPSTRFVDEQEGVIAYPLLPGRPLLGRPAPDGLATRLGRFLKELHAITTTNAPVEPAEPEAWLEEIEGPAELIRILHEDVPATSRDAVLAHADLGAEHILEHDGEVTGIIDWSDAAVTDPALDFARLHRDFGPDFLQWVRESYGELPDHGRIVFFARCAALEDLAYGGAHARAAERALGRLFST